MKLLNLYATSLIIGLTITACNSNEKGQKEYTITPELATAIQKYDEVIEFDRGVFTVVKDGKKGLVNIDGNEIMPCKYDNISSFSEEGLAKVELNRKYGYVDTRWKEVVPCKYDDADTFSEGLASVKLNGKYGLIDTQGKEVVPCRYDFVASFSEGLASAKLNGKWGFIDTQGKEVIPCKYDFVASFSEGLIKVELNGKWKLIDTQGDEVSSLSYDYIEPLSEGLASVKLNGKYGFIDAQGKEVIPCKYDGAHTFSEGLASVNLNGKWGFIDTQGKEMIPYKYVLAYPFSEGLAYVWLNRKSGFIDTQGKEVILCKYDYDVVHSFSEGLASVQLNGKWGFIDTQGKKVIPCRYDFVYSFSEGLIGVKLNGKWGFIDTQGKEVIPCRYDIVASFSKGLARVELNGKWGFIDKKGNSTFLFDADAVTSKDNNSSKDANLTYQSEENDMKIENATSNSIEKQETCDVRNLKESRYHDTENELLNGKVRSLEWSDGQSSNIIKFNQNGDYQSVVRNGRTTPLPTIPKFFIEGRLFDRYVHPVFSSLTGHISFDNIFRGYGCAYYDYFNPYSIYRGVSELQYFYDDKSNISTIQTDEGKIEYRYDENGLLRECLVNNLPLLQIKRIDDLVSEICFYNEDGSLWSGYDISYKDNLVIQEIKKSGEDIILFFNTNGNVVKIDNQMNKEQNFKSFITYDNKGRISNIKRLYNGEDDGEEIIRYDQYNNVTDILIRNGSGSRFKYKYDDFGNWIQKDIYKVIVGDTEIEKKIGTETRKIEYYE